MAAPFWRLTLAAAAGAEFRELSSAYGRRVTFRLDATPDAQFSIDGAAEEALEIDELSTDLVMYRTNQSGTQEKLFRGRIGAEQDDLTPENHSCQFSARGYRGLLAGNRAVNTAVTYTGVDTGVIGWNLIVAMQALAGGNYNITNGTGSGGSGTSINKSYDPGVYVGDAIATLGRRATGGFEWEIGADMTFNRWYPTRGSATGAVLDFGGTVERVRKTLSVDDFANAVIAVGDGDSTVPVVAVSATVGTDPSGRWETVSSYSGISVQSDLQSKADYDLSVTKVLRPTWLVTLVPGTWYKATMWLGDTVRLVARKNRLNVNALFRIVEVNISIDVDNVEHVGLGLVAI